MAASASASTLPSWSWTFQRCFVDPSIPGGGDFSDAIDATARLLGAARSRGVPIVYTVVAYDDPAGTPAGSSTSARR